MGAPFVRCWYSDCRRIAGSRSFCAAILVTNEILPPGLSTHEMERESKNSNMVSCCSSDAVALVSNEICEDGWFVPTYHPAIYQWAGSSQSKYRRSETSSFFFAGGCLRGCVGRKPRDHAKPGITLANGVVPGPRRWADEVGASLESYRDKLDFW